MSQKFQTREQLLAELAKACWREVAQLIAEGHTPVSRKFYTNASDAMPQGGTLTVRVGAGEPGGVGIQIADTGVGIAPEDLSRVVEPFFTTKPEGKGTGLGLAICRRIAQEHRGTFRIDSEPGRGTTVHIALPVANGTNAAALRQER